MFPHNLPLYGNFSPNCDFPKNVVFFLPFFGPKSPSKMFFHVLRSFLRRSGVQKKKRFDRKIGPFSGPRKCLGQRSEIRSKIWIFLKFDHFGWLFSWSYFFSKKYISCVPDPPKQVKNAPKQFIWPKTRETHKKKWAEKN